MRLASLLLGLSILIILLGISIGSNELAHPGVVQINCPDSQGCFRVIEHAVQSAVLGTTLSIGPGIYYEKPITIDKSLIIEGAQSNSSDRTRIVLVDIGTAITILGHQAISVELRRLAIDALATDIIHGGSSAGLDIYSQTTEKMQIDVNDVTISSPIGVVIRGKQSGEVAVDIAKSTIRAYSGVSMAAGHLTLSESSLLGSNADYPEVSQRIPGFGITLEPGPSQPVPLSNVEAIFKGDVIQGFTTGIFVLSSSRLRQGSVKVQLTGNEISSNADGIYLLGDQVTVQLSENEIHMNQYYGIKLALLTCVPDLVHGGEFQGVLQGSENKLYDNKQGDLCPPDYPWPSGFTTQTSSSKAGGP